MASKAKWLRRAQLPAGVVLGALCATILPAQTPGSELSLSAAGPPATADAVIEEMAVAAGAIFAGQVTAVRAPGGSPSGSPSESKGIVEVDFRVDQAVEGPVAGSVYTLREWAGLWDAAGGRERYRAGQRVLIFLYAPDANGFSSPVRGLDGAIPLHGGGTAPAPEDASTAAAEWMVDLRWVQAQAARTGATLPLPVRGPVRPTPIFPRPGVPRPISEAMPHGEAVPDSEVARTAMEPEPPIVLRLPVFTPQPVAPVETQPLAFVIGLCKEAIGQRTMPQEPVGRDAVNQDAVGQPTMGRQAKGRQAEGPRAMDPQATRQTDETR